MTLQDLIIGSSYDIPFQSEYLPISLSGCEHTASFSSLDHRNGRLHVEEKQRPVFDHDGLLTTSIRPRYRQWCKLGRTKASRFG